jgi:hypothetical protein
MKPIPQEWIRDHVDKMLLLAATLPAGSPMRTAIVLRAEHTMDMVQAWQEHR